MCWTKCASRATTTSSVFTEVFQRGIAKAGKKQYIVPYFIASHPGSDLDAMIDLACFLKQNGYQPDQVQDFIPAPFDVATAMYYTGHRSVYARNRCYVAKQLRDRKLQRALMQFFKPENYFEVRKALQQAGRQDLIGRRLRLLDPFQTAQGSPASTAPGRQPALQRRLRSPDRRRQGLRQKESTRLQAQQQTIPRQARQRLSSGEGGRVEVRR